jgi:uncharacterized lipoprotein YmbA
MRIYYWKMIVVSLFVIGVTGCGGSKPSRYYLLTGHTGSSESRADPKDIKIGLGPIQFPEYLRRPQLASYVGSNQLNLAEYDRWAEPLEGNFSRVMAENLTELIPTDQVHIYPFIGNISLDYSIIIEVRKFEMDAQSQVKLIAQWQILQEAEKKPLTIKRSEYLEAVNSENYESVVAGMSKITTALSREIAKTINSLP